MYDNGDEATESQYWFVGFLVLFGVPLFGGCLGHLAGILVGQYIASKTKQVARGRVRACVVRRWCACWLREQRTALALAACSNERRNLRLGAEIGSRRNGRTRSLRSPTSLMAGRPTASLTSLSSCS